MGMTTARSLSLLTASILGHATFSGYLLPGRVASHAIFQTGTSALVPLPHSVALCRLLSSFGLCLPSPAASVAFCCLPVARCSILSPAAPFCRPPPNSTLWPSAVCLPSSDAFAPRTMKFRADFVPLSPARKIWKKSLKNFALDCELFLQLVWRSNPHNMVS